MMTGDFITLTQMGLPVKVMVKNGTLGFVEMGVRAGDSWTPAVISRTPTLR
jgi:pyruvate dehydrogenase (quinone)